MDTPSVSHTPRLFTGKELALLVAPLIVEQALGLIVGVVDSVMVAGIGEDAVSGVSLVDTVMQLAILVFGAFGTGGAVVAGQYLGSGRDDLARRAGRQLIWFAGIVSLMITAALYLSRNLILTGVFGDISPVVHAHAGRYLLAVAFSVPAIALYSAGAAMFRTMGNARVTMWMSILMNLLNVGGNALFIYGLRLGTAGAGIATASARYAAAIGILLLLRRPSLPLRLEGGLRWQPDGDLIRRILRVAVPGGVENGMFQLGKILILRMITVFGSGAIAANSISTSIALIQCMPGLAMELAIVPVIARCIGAGELRQARHYNRLLIGIAYALNIAFCAVTILGMPVILEWYRLSPETAGLVRQMSLIHGIGCSLIWPLSFVLPCSLRAAGDNTYAMGISVFSMWVFRIFAAALFTRIPAIGPCGVWFAMVTDWGFRTIAYCIRWAGGKWAEKKVID